MTTAAQKIIKTAQGILKDLAGIRWPATELVESLNDAQRDIATLRPDLMATSEPYPLALGARQVVPVNCSKLIDIPRNTTGAGIRQVNRDDLDSFNPDWYSLPGAIRIKHFAHDPKEPNVFWVYPPASAGASVNVAFAAMPVDVPPATGPGFASVTGNLGVADVFANAALSFVLSRAYAKDAESGGNAVLTAQYKAEFKTAMGDDLTTRQAVKPAIKTTPE